MSELAEQLWKELSEKSYEEGFKAGKAEIGSKAAEFLIRDGRFSEEKISELTGLPMETIEEIKKRVSA